MHDSIFPSTAQPLQIRPVPLQTLIIPTQELPTQTLLPPHGQPRNHTPRLLGPHQLPLPMQPVKLLLVAAAHRHIMLLPDRALHLRIHDARPNTNRRDIRLLDAQRSRNMIQHRFARPIRAPALVRAARRATTRDDDATFCLAQLGQRSLNHGHTAEDVGVVGGAPLFDGAVCDLLDWVEGAVV